MPKINNGPRSILNTKQPRKGAGQTALAKRAKTFALLPAELVELRTRQDILIEKLDKAIQEEDIQAIYWINAEVQTICHIYGLPAPQGTGVGTEILRGLREMRSLAIPETSTNNVDAMKAILTSALQDAAKIRGEERSDEEASS